jgi:hypothetical protein
MELLEFSENVFTVFNSLAPFSENVKKQFFEFCSLKNLKKLAEIFSQKEHPPQAEKKSHKSSVEEIPLLSLNSKLPSRENGYKELSQGEREWKEEENRCCRIL